MRRLLSRLSMRRKLVLMFLGTTILLHVVVGEVASRAIRSYFVDLAYEYIDERYAVINQNTSDSNYSPMVVKGFELSKLIVWKVESGQVTYHNSPTPLPFSAARFALLNKDDFYAQKWRVKHDHFLAKSFFISKHSTLVIGVNINHHIAFFNAVSNTIFWFTLFVSVFVALYSVVIVTDGLRPLKVFEGYLSRIRPGHLDIRIPTEKLPSELEQLGQVQNSMLDRLDQGFQRLSDFSSDIAHELRTPLTNMTTETQVVLSNERTAEEYRDTLGSNLEELERITKTINDTLYLAKAENSLLYQKNETLDLKREISQLVEYQNIVAEDKDVSIVMTGEGELYIDKHMFQRAINNLLSNAIRHAASDSVINVIVQDSVEALRISVVNTGDTIPKETLPFIFDRFYRGDCSRESDGGVGAGLGLAITKSIIEVYGGEINVSSESGKTVFEIFFPL